MKDNSKYINRLIDTENLSLMLEIGFSDFSALVFDKLKKETVFTESITFTHLNQLKEKSEVLSASFQDVKALVFTPDFTIIPDALIENNSEKSYLELACGKKHEEIRTTHLSFSNATIAYYYNTGVSGFLRTIYPNAEINHSAKGLLNTTNTSSTNTLRIHLYNNYLIAAYFDNKQLQLLNSFEYNHFNDLIYSLLFIAKEFKLKNTETTVQISGFYNPNHIPMMEKYFKQVSIQPSTINNEQAARYALLESL